MDFLLQIQQIVEGPIKDLLLQLHLEAPHFTVTTPPPVTITGPEKVGDINVGSTFGDFAPQLNGMGSTFGDFAPQLNHLGSSDFDFLNGAGSSNFANQAGSTNFANQAGSSEIFGGFGGQTSSQTSTNGNQDFGLGSSGLKLPIPGLG